MQELKYKKVLDSFIQFIGEFTDYYKPLPHDLKMTLDDIYNHIVRNKKNG